MEQKGNAINSFVRRKFVAPVVANHMEKSRHFEDSDKKEELPIAVKIVCAIEKATR